MNATEVGALVCERAKDLLQDNLFAAIQYGSAVWDPEAPATDLDMHLMLRTRSDLDDGTRERLTKMLEDIQRETGLEQDIWLIALDEAHESRPRDLRHASLRDESWPLHRSHWLAGKALVLHGPAVETWITAPEPEETQRALTQELAFCVRTASNPQRIEWPLFDAYLVRQGCRLLASAATGDVVLSKSDGTAWALANLSEQWLPLIRAADAAYVNADHDRGLLRDNSDRFLAFVRRELGWTQQLQIFGVQGIPEIIPGADLAEIICARVALEPNDVIVVAQKIVSKTEGRVVSSDSPAVGAETKRIVARAGDVVIAETRHGFVCANAGVDESNTEPGTAVLLPLDPDASAARIRDGIFSRSSVNVGVIVSDTFGRPWRIGQTNVAIGVAGMAPLRDLRGTSDRTGREMGATVIADADELAGAAELVMGKSEGVPVAIIRGIWTLGRPGKASDLVRPASEDLFPRGLGGDA